MIKLDDIQERITVIKREGEVSFLPSDVGRTLDVLTDIVTELKRIDAEQQATENVVRQLSDIHP